MFWSATTILLARWNPRANGLVQAAQTSFLHRKRSLRRAARSLRGLSEGAGVMRQYKDKSPANIEREVAAYRADIADTVAEIKERLSPAELLERILRDSRTRDVVARIGPAIGRNPLPAVLIGIGALWLALASTRPEPLPAHAQAPALGRIPGGNASRKGNPDGCEQRESDGLAARRARHGEPGDRDSREAGKPPRALSGAARESALASRRDRTAKPSGWSAACISSGRIRPG